MKIHHCILGALALIAPAACYVDSHHYHYVYNPYTGYYVVVSDDRYYDAAVVGGYYAAPTVVHASGTTAQPLVPAAAQTLLTHWKATIDPACVSTTGYTSTFDCDGRNTAGSAVRVNGKVTRKDLDDAVADAGYTIAFDGFKVTVTSSASAVTEHVLDGTQTVRKTGAGADLELTRDLLVHATETAPDGFQHVSMLRMQGASRFTPDPVQGGPNVTKGTLTLTGEGTFAGDDGTTASVTRQSQPALHWNSDCAGAPDGQPFDSGAVDYRSSTGFETRIAHDTCTNVTVTNTEPPP